MSVTIPAPTIVSSGVTDVRQFGATLTDAELVTAPDTDGHGRARTFRPDAFELRWNDGQLRVAAMSGPRLRPDGVTLYASRERVTVSFLGRTDVGYVGDDGRWVGAWAYSLAADAPRWVRQLVEEHAPA